MLIFIWLTSQKLLEKRTRAATIIFAVVILCLEALSISSCGSGGGGGSGLPPSYGTQAGIYTVTITGTTSQAIHTTFVVLTVQ